MTLLKLRRSRNQKASTSTFPLSVHSSGRYLLDAGGNPHPILGRASWDMIGISQSAQQSYLQDTLAKGFNAIELSIPHHQPSAPNPPFDGAGNLPFSKRNDGTSWDGSFFYGNGSNDMPDFTQPNEAYWSGVDALVAYCATNGIQMHWFPSYTGWWTGPDGWDTEMVGNGTTKMQTYGAWIANRYKSYGNIIWMLGGDAGTSPGLWDAPTTAAVQALVDGLTSVSGQQSTNFGAEWDSNSTGTSQATFSSYMTLNGAYSWDGHVATWARNSYSHSPAIPAYYMEGPYDEEGADGNNFNPNASQPVRRHNWWGWLSSIGGYITGNGYVWPFNTGYASHLNTAGAQQCAILNAFIVSLSNWYALVPSGLGSIGTLVTSGGGTIDTSDYVSAAATPDGSLLIAYRGPGSSSGITIDMTKLRGTVTARWFDPTNATYTAIGSFANTGTHAFTPGGNNNAGDADWVLRLDA